ncbi:type I-E CRISPR-associated protein Cas6/Cse3/CasE [Okibacterium endophyticum]
MFITRMAINGARRQAQFLLRSPQAMHAAVLAAFPPDAPTETSEGRVLWRVDQETERHSIWLYVVSPEKPDFTHLIEQAGWPTRETWETRDYAPFVGRIAADQRWAFRLLANPIRTGDDGKRYGHVTIAQQTGWLVDRAERHGFIVTSSSSGEDDVLVTQRDKKTFRRENRQVTISTARFDGRLQVTDPDQLRHALTHGIGRAKGYGCGLLTLVPVA